MYGNNKRAESPKPTATIVIGESKVLDLSSLLGKKNGVNFNSSPSSNNNKNNGSSQSYSKTSVKSENNKNGTSTAPIFATKTPIVHSKAYPSTSFSSRSSNSHSKPETSSVFDSRSSLAQVISNSKFDVYSKTDQLTALLQKASTSGNSIAVQSKATKLLELINSAKKPQQQEQQQQQSWNLRLCFSDNYIYFKDNKVTTREYGESGIQFKCTYPGCGKRSSTNINFMYHVWSHVKRLHFKSTTNGSIYNISYGIGDVEKPVAERSTLHCIDCLTEFTSTHKLQKHIFYVHRRGIHSDTHPVCHICEKEVDLNSVDKHADRHGEFEMPFECPICSWRSSSRPSLLYHFERCHNAGTTLICPFCLDKFPIKKPSTTKSERTILTSTNFVEHLLEHFEDGVKKSNCPRCSLKFCADTYQELTEKLKLHSEMHKSASKLKFERKSLKELFETNPNQRYAEVKALAPHCTDCGYRIKTLDSHYRKRQLCENNNCGFETRCKIAFTQHTTLCPLKDTSVSRIPFGKNNLDKDHLMNSFNKERIRLRCNFCMFTSRDSAIFNDHLSKECIGAKHFHGQASPLETPRKRELTSDEKCETCLFGVHLDPKRFKYQKFEEFLNEDNQVQTNWLQKVVPFVADKNLAIFKKSAIVKSLSIVDQIGPSATNDFYNITKFFCEEDQDAKKLENATKLAQKLFPASRFPQRKM